MIVIIGHGPSLLGKGRGAWIDQQFVVRLKGAAIPNAEDWGSRTDAICGYHLHFQQAGIPFWWFPKSGDNRQIPGVQIARADYWRSRYAEFQPGYKMSTGLAAICAALDLAQPTPTVIGLAGYDNLLRPDEKGWTKWSVPRHVSSYRHDAHAEHAFAMSLGVQFIDVTDEAQCQTSSTTTPSSDSATTTPSTKEPEKPASTRRRTSRGSSSTRRSSPPTA